MMRSWDKEKELGRTPVVRRATAWFTRRRGETSTACRRTVPCEPIRVESSRGPVLTIASTRTYRAIVNQKKNKTGVQKLTDLNGVLIRQEVDDFERMRDDA